MEKADSPVPTQPRRAPGCRHAPSPPERAPGAKQGRILSKLEFMKLKTASEMASPTPSLEPQQLGKQSAGLPCTLSRNCSWLRREQEPLTNSSSVQELKSGKLPADERRCVHRLQRQRSKGLRTELPVWRVLVTPPGHTTLSLCRSSQSGHSLCPIAPPPRG